MFYSYLKEFEKGRALQVKPRQRLETRRREREPQAAAAAALGHKHKPTAVNGETTPLSAGTSGRRGETERDVLASLPRTR